MCAPPRFIPAEMNRARRLLSCVFSMHGSYLFSVYSPARLAGALVLLLAIATAALVAEGISDAQAGSLSSNPVWQRRNVVPGPPERWGAGMAFDMASGRSVIFGGINNTGKLGDTWIRQNGVWVQVMPSNAPTARLGAAMCYDQARGKIVLFGG